MRSSLLNQGQNATARRKQTPTGRPGLIADVMLDAQSNRWNGSQKQTNSGSEQEFVGRLNWWGFG
jgi:hypothetical protein